MATVIDGTIGVQGNSGAFIADTAKTASGSTVDFTSIPSWVKRITVLINGLSYAAAGVGVIRIGSGALETTGYSCSITGLSTVPTINFSSATNGFGSLNTGGSASTVVGQATLVLISGNTWVYNQITQRPADSVTNISTGLIALSGALDRLSLVATTSTFDAGTVNILFE